MKKWIFWLIFAITLCSGCKTIEKSISTDTEQTHVTVYDTTRVVNTYNVVDTTHVEYLNTTTTHTVEYYDPETGQLRQRVIDQESNIQYLQDQLFALQYMLDSMRTITKDTTHIETHVEVEEKIAKVRSVLDEILEFVRISIACVVVAAIFFLFRPLFKKIKSQHN